MQVLCPWCLIPVEVVTTANGESSCAGCGRQLVRVGPNTRPNDETINAPQYEPIEPENDDAPKQLGRYHINARLGSGGFGTVYVGLDEELRRLVAIKVPHGHRVASSEDAEAYLKEARILAGLDHPNIVPVYDVGRTAEGVCYVVSKFIEGRDLVARLREEPVSHEEAVRLVAQVAEALQHAHDRGLVHRDVKPGNILLDLSGRPYVSDFGLALREEDFATGPSFAGTPSYMSPEQARSEGHRVDGRTDIYSLGVAFYEMLTRRLPFEGEMLDELLEQILTREVRPPRALDGSIPPELERICLKCLAKRAADRYATARELALDLRHWLSEQANGRSKPAGEAIDRREDPRHSRVRVVPKGLRSFDAHDADFFLELLPGPRDREGLPASISFWKARVESRDPAGTFSVGLIYGPSGCGKSSLVRAGLVPRLAPEVTVVTIDAAREGTEARLLAAIRRVCPDVEGERDLPGVVAAIRRGKSLSEGRKLLLVIDQFEQCFHGERDRLAASPLVAALRQAFGPRVQFLLLARDDFWLAASRLFQQLEIPLVEGQNLELVDLFEPAHARRVLQLFGQAYGCLPANPAEITAEQHAFLEQAVAGLAEDGKVISVRLALFADMMKGRPWTTQTLQAVGGTQGIGLTFLRETFSVRSASPERRGYEKEARAVLAALLPEAGSAIKGRVRSASDLLAASGLREDFRRFERLLEILDRELRIITPAEAPEDHPAADGRFYQLTHDFLVPALREWLTQKKRETWRGRAELALEERTRQWVRSTEDRFLPSPVEYVAISLGVPRRRWAKEQRDLMAAATRHYGLIAIAAVAVLALVGWSLWHVNGRSQGRRLAQAIELAEPTELPRLIREELPRYRLWADPQLRAMAGNRAADAGQRLRASLALLDRDPNQIEYLRERLLDCPLREFRVVRDSLAGHGDQLAPFLWEALRDGRRPPAERFQAGLALTAYAPADNAWTEADARFVTEQLLLANRDDHDDYRELLRPAATRFLTPLEAVFRDTAARNTLRAAAADALVDLAPDQTTLLAELAAVATPEQFDVLQPVLTAAPPAARAQAAERLQGFVQERAPSALAEHQRLALGRRRAGAAITLLHLGRRDTARVVFHETDDPEALTQFIHGVKDRRVEPEVLLDCLEEAKHVPERFALLLALGEFRLADVPEGPREALVERLVRWYGTDPSSAIHGACGWLLRHWGFTKEADRVDRTPLACDRTGQRDWFVEAIGDDRFTFIVFPAASFVMGSPAEEGYRQQNEKEHRVRLTRPFALADRELTRAQYERFARATSTPFPKHDEASPTPAHPASRATWAEAVGYCRWLTGEAKQAASQQAYDAPDSLVKGPDGTPRTWPLHAERLGFRLPTEAEWEHACRAGTVTAYSFGSDRELLARYGRHLEEAAHVLGTLRPNLRGLFDMHGNVWEWCHDWYTADLSDSADPVGPSEGKNKTLRGGGWDRSPWHCRSAYRHSPTPDYRASYMGFRIACTLPQ